MSAPLSSLLKFGKRASRTAAARGRRSRPDGRKFRLAFEQVEPRHMLSGTWTEVTHAAIPGAAGTMMLLPNGSVLAQTGGTTNTWYKLTPDINGSYVNGTWSPTGSTNFSRLYFASNVLSNGKVFLVGGEYSNATTTTGGSLTNTAEMYDVATGAWTNLPSVPSSLAGSWSWGINSGTPFGDDPSVVLPDGRILCGFIFDKRTLIFNPATNTWSAGPDKLHNDPSDEEGWVKLANGNILSYDIFSAGTAQMFVPSANSGAGAWIATGAVPALSLTSSAVGYELGPGSLLPDGRVFYLGATGHTAIYTPGATNMDPGSWVQGPDILNASGQLMGADDAPAAVLPNGHVLFTADSVHIAKFTAPTEIYDYDPATNTISSVASLPNMILNSEPSYIDRMLVLPNGQVLFSAGDSFGSTSPLFFYTPSGGPQFSWRPSISGITSHGGGSFTLTGTQLNGMSEGAAYGDDAEMAENYPIVQLRASNGHVYYAMTSNWSSNGVQTGSELVHTDFKLPAGIPAGNYLVTVSASGISSLPQALHIGSGDLPPAAPPGSADGVASSTLVVAPSTTLSLAPISVPGPGGAVFGSEDTTMEESLHPYVPDWVSRYIPTAPATAPAPITQVWPSVSGPTIAATDALFGMHSFAADLAPRGRMRW